MYQQGPQAPPIDEPAQHVDVPQDPANPAPLTLRQLHALAAATIRQLGWGLRSAARETRNWRTRAAQIPDREIREDALSALADKRGHIDGAALFWTIPQRRNTHLLRLLVAYQIMWDLLDNLSERGATAGRTNGEQLHTALIDALDRVRPIRDYYRWHPSKEDGGYLRVLVEASRQACQRMPSYFAIRETVIRDARRAGVQAINHEPNQTTRASALRVWVLGEKSGEEDMSWYEFAGAASAGLSIYGLLATSAGQAHSSDIDRVYGAYFPSISAVTTMLDSYVDQAEDAQTGDHSYIAYYPTTASVVPSIARLMRCGLDATRPLQQAERHRVIVACMIALHLSRDSAWSMTLRRGTGQLARSGGSLTLLLMPALRLWRIVYSQRST